MPPNDYQLPVTSNEDIPISVAETLKESSNREYISQKSIVDCLRFFSFLAFPTVLELCLVRIRLDWDEIRCFRFSAQLPMTLQSVNGFKAGLFDGFDSCWLAEKGTGRSELEISVGETKRFSEIRSGKKTVTSTIPAAYKRAESCNSR